MSGATHVQEVRACRSCGSGRLDVFLPLGLTPLANSLLPAGQSAESSPRYPLTVMRCEDCSLVQLKEIVPPEDLFSHYLYFSSVSPAIVSHAESLAGAVMAREKLGGAALVVEIASNDGYLLQFFKQAGVPVLGIEPAQNIARVAQEQRGIPTLTRFFGHELAAELAAEGRLADVILGNNVLAHVPDLSGFAAGVATLLKPAGVAVFEFPYLKDLLDNVEFDTIYHEHQCYFSLTAVQTVFNQHGLEVSDVGHEDIHGGSLRIWVSPKASRPTSTAVTEMLAAERGWGVETSGPYEQLSGSVQRLKSQLLETLDSIKAGGRRVAAYGAAAKGVTLTSYCGIGSQYLDYVVDRSRHKQGLGFPVDGLPIFAPEKLVEDKPDYTLLLTWNFANEILAQQSDYRGLGG
ncbi:MAG TPA: class I SAM-dependent methyltransferase, partial [Chloroflexota bacterium]|nr:class I SAM-dependent methyltransferase [Chloroflexota bacterium]